MVTETRYFREDYWATDWRKLLNTFLGVPAGSCNTIPFVDGNYDSRFCFGIDVRNVLFDGVNVSLIQNISNGIVAKQSRVAAIGETVNEFAYGTYTPPKTTGVRWLLVCFWTQVWSPQQVCGYGGGGDAGYRGCGCTPSYPTFCYGSRFLTEDFGGATLEATEWTVRYRIQKIISADGYAQWSLLWGIASTFAARIANFSYTPVVAAKKRLLVGVGI